jgi:death-on-curing protein
MDEMAISFDDDTVFLTVEQVIEIHHAAVKRYSPGESFRIRDEGLLNSAVMTPQQTFDGYNIYENILEMATAYLFGLALNHPFENGNKRVGFAVCSVFLRMNEYRLILSQNEAVDLTFGVINHSLSRENVADILENPID